MMNAFNTCGTCEVSRICWSTSLSNTLDSFPTGATPVDTPINPCFSLAYTSLFAPSESLLALLPPLETPVNVDGVNDITTNNTYLSVDLYYEDEPSLSKMAHMLQHIS